MEISIPIIVFLGFTMYAANKVQGGAWSESVIKILWYMAAATIFLLAVFPLQIVFIGSENSAVELPKVSIAAAVGAFVFATLCGLLSLSVVNSVQVRDGIARLIGNHGKFDPNSAVHITGVILSCLLLTGVIALFVASGGLEGMAESIEATGVNPLDTVFTCVVELMAAALSVGYTIRRTEAQTLARLGLQIPNSRAVRYGIAVGVGLIAVEIAYGLIWQQVALPDQVRDQTQAVEQITLALSSIPMALLVSAAAALGEEVFVRGALQPVFGIWFSSLFFTLLHTQYLITPPLLLIFAISIVLGLLRQRFNTTTAIIAHFVYNLIPLLLIALGGAANS